MSCLIIDFTYPCRFGTLSSFLIMSSSVLWFSLIETTVVFSLIHLFFASLSGIDTPSILWYNSSNRAACHLGWRLFQHSIRSQRERRLPLWWAVISVLYVCINRWLLRLITLTVTVLTIQPCSHPLAGNNLAAVLLVYINIGNAYCQHFFESFSTNPKFPSVQGLYLIVKVLYPASGGWHYIRLIVCVISDSALTLRSYFGFPTLSAFACLNCLYYITIIRDSPLTIVTNIRDIPCAFCHLY